MLYWEMITICFAMHIKHTNEFHGHRRTVEYKTWRHTMSPDMTVVPKIKVP